MLVRKLAFGAVLVVLAVSVPPSASAAAPDREQMVTVAEVAEDVAIDLAPDGTLYVLDRETGGLSTVDADGRVEAVPGTEQIKAVDVDAVDGAVYLLTTTELWRVDGDGQATLVLGAGTLVDPLSIAVDTTGAVYVVERIGSDKVNSRIRKLAPDGAVTTIAGEGGIDIAEMPFDGRRATDTKLYRPRELAFDSRGGLYFTDYIGKHGLAVLMISPSGVIRQVSVDLVGDDEVDDGDLVVGADDRVYVLDTMIGVGGVRILDREGRLTFAGPNVFAPEDIAVRPDGDIYLAAGGRILLLSRDDAPDGDPPRGSQGVDPWKDKESGTVLTVAGTASDLGRRKLEWAPQDVAVGTDGAVHVVAGGRIRTIVGSTKVSSRMADAPLGTVDVTAIEIAPAADGALYVHADVLLRQPDEKGAVDGPQLVLQVHPDKDVVPVVMGGSPWYGMFGHVDPGVIPINISSADGHLVLTDIQGTIWRFTGIDSLREVTKLDTLPRTYAVDKATVYYIDNSQVFRVDPGKDPQRIAGNTTPAPDRGNGDGGSALDAVIAEVRDMVVAPDGTVYLATDEGIRAVFPDNTIDTVAPAKADRLAADAYGNLYFIDKRTVRVLVRPVQVTEFPWEFAAAGAAALAAVGAGFLVFRHRRRRTEADATAPATGAE